VEYTDAPTQASSDLTDKMACPYCGHLLPKDAQACDRCDWTRKETQIAEGKASDAVAVLLSVVPGLGHIYKGHRLLGTLLMLVGTPMAIAVAALTFTFTAGFGGFLLPLYWFAVMFHVYGIEDRVGPPKEDEGEQY
jgi:ribosomal protein L40E